MQPYLIIFPQKVAFKIINFHSRNTAGQRLKPHHFKHFCSLSIHFFSLSFFFSYSSLHFFSFCFSFSSMERPESEGFGGRRRRPVKNEVPVRAQRPLRRTLSLPPAAKPPPPEVKLAAVAVDLNVRLRSADMSAAMQERAFRYARSLLDAHSDNVPTPTHLAMRLKKVRWLKPPPFD